MGEAVMPVEIIPTDNTASPYRSPKIHSAQFSPTDYVHTFKCNLSKNNILLHNNNKIGSNREVH